MLNRGVKALKGPIIMIMILFVGLAVEDKYKNSFEDVVWFVSLKAVISVAFVPR